MVRRAARAGATSPEKSTDRVASPSMVTASYERAHLLTRDEAWRIARTSPGCRNCSAPRRGRKPIRLFTGGRLRPARYGMVTYFVMDDVRKCVVL